MSRSLYFSFKTNHSHYLKMLLLFFYFKLIFCKENMAAVSIVFLDQSPYVACQAAKARVSVVGRLRVSSYLFGFV